MVIGQVVMVDEEDRWLQLTGPPAAAAGRVVADFLAQQAVAQIAQFAGVAVRRDAYERTGGFCTLFGHVADRDMWFRVGQLGPVWCTSRPYGLYRMHGGQDTGQQMVRGTNILEFHLSTEVNLARLGGPNHREAARAARRASGTTGLRQRPEALPARASGGEPRAGEPRPPTLPERPGGGPLDPGLGPPRARRQHGAHLTQGYSRYPRARRCSATRASSSPDSQPARGVGGARSSSTKRTGCAAR